MVSVLTYWSVAWKIQNNKKIVHNIFEAVYENGNRDPYTSFEVVQT